MAMIDAYATRNGCFWLAVPEAPGGVIGRFRQSRRSYCAVYQTGVGRDEPSATAGSLLCPRSCADIAPKLVNDDRWAKINLSFD
jgi:hypothetical protein